MQYEWNHPVVRRGEIFEFSFEERQYLFDFVNMDDTRLQLVANGGIVPEKKVLYNAESASINDWNLRLSEVAGKRYAVSLATPCDCEPGEYEISLMNKNKKLVLITFLMLFNPWNPEDEVYIRQEEDRKEYVLNTKTIIYQGCADSILNKHWSLDQFSTPAIELLLYFLRKIDRSLRSSAPALARELTALTNNLDDNGVITGRWNGVYTPGKFPNYWTGSKEIFEKYLKDKQPVKYGQCFTFAAVLCSLIRLVGIGCRIVSCFDSLCDSDDTLDMEVYYDKDNNFLSYYTKDSMWNFHCWNECYMECGEFEKYNGWHVCDATPQKISTDGRYTCGPAPVAAIKAGDLKVGYDSRFVFSEVNGDMILYRVVNGKKEVFDVQISRIGHKISTKAVGSDSRIDITDNYKYADGSTMDIIARKNADGRLKKFPQNGKIISFHQTNNKDHILMGNDLILNIDLLQVSDSPVALLIKCFVIQHPNIRSKEIANKKVTLAPNGQSSVLFKVGSNEILHYVQSDLCGILVEVFISEKESFYMQDCRFSLVTPSFDITLPKRIKIGEVCTILIHMNNPMPVRMKDVTVKLKTDFIEQNQKIYIRKLSKGRPIYAKFNVVPKKKGFFEVKVIIYGSTIPTFHEVKSVNVV